MRLGSLIGLAFCGSLIASAQTTNPPPTSRLLSLQQCLDMALSRNLDLQIEHLSPQIARYDMISAQGAYDPTLSFQAVSKFIEQPGDFDPRKQNPYLPYDDRSDTVGPDLSGRLPLGLSYELNAVAGPDSAHTDMRSTDQAADYPGGVRNTNNYYADAELTVRQHLLKDFWIDSYREKLLFRKKDLKISQEALRLQIMKTTLAVELNFFDLLAAREKIAVEEKALEVKRQFVTETRRRIQVGDLPPLDGQQAESQLQNIITALTAARQVLVEQQNELIGLMTDDFKSWADVDLQPVGPLVAVQEEPDRFQSFQNALTKRPDVAAARSAVEKSDVAVRFQKNQLFPSLDFTGTYGGNGIDPQAGSAISDAVHLRYHQYSYGVVASIPLGNVTARNDYKASQAAREVARLQLKKAEQQILIQIADYVSRVPSQFSQTVSTRQARIYADTALAAEQKKWQNGLTTSFDVLLFQDALTAARNAEVDALAEYNKVVAQFAFAEGTILERRHLSLELK